MLHMISSEEKEIGKVYVVYNTFKTAINRNFIYQAIPYRSKMKIIILDD